MGLVQRPDLPERIRRAFGLREPGVGATISPEIVPVVLVDDLTGPSIDEGYPRTALARMVNPAAAGLYSTAIIVNPPESRVDVLISSFWIEVIAGGVSYSMRSGLVSTLPAPIAAGSEIHFLDRRVSGLPGARIEYHQTAGYLTADFIIVLNTPSIGLLNIPLGLTLPPGRWFGASRTVVNQTITAWWWWTERLRTTT